MLLPATSRGGVVLERDVVRASGDLVRLVQVFTGDDLRTLVTHRAFVVAHVEVEQGAISFPLSSQDVRAPERFLLLVPPCSVLPMRFHRARVRSEGVGGFFPIGFDSPKLFGLEQGAPSLLGHAAVREALRAPEIAHLDADAGAPLFASRARRLLHDLLADPAPVAAAARKVGCAPETLARAFSRAYGLSPKQYCHRARLFEAVLRLLQGASVVEAALASGFGDLRRFYVQFHRLLDATPGLYARVRKRQDS